MSTRCIVITSTLVGALATGANAQITNAQRSAQTQQLQALRQATSGRLIVPVTGALATSATTTTSADSAASSLNQVIGSFAIQRFAQTTTGDVAAFGMLTLNLTDASGAARAIVTEAAMPMAQSPNGSSALTPSRTTPTTAASAVVLSSDSRSTQTPSAQGCETLSLVLRPVQLDVLGMAIQIDQVNVNVISRTTGQLRNLLCGSTSATGGISAADRMNMLNALLDVVG
jgi:hypothetical protein